MAQIHRFSDLVALYVDGRETAYLTPMEARALASWLMAVASDIELSRFGASLNPTTFNVDLDSDLSASRDFKQERG